MGFFSSLHEGESSVNLKELINQDAFLVDVREPSEFASGSVKGATNIPLGTIASEINQFKNKKNIIVFCRSGMRSGQAKAILETNVISGIYNGGTWQNVAANID